MSKPLSAWVLVSALSLVSSIGAANPAPCAHGVTVTSTDESVTLTCTGPYGEGGCDSRVYRAPRVFGWDEIDAKDPDVVEAVVDWTSSNCSTPDPDYPSGGSVCGFKGIEDCVPPGRWYYFHEGSQFCGMGYGEALPSVGVANVGQPCKPPAEDPGSQAPDVPASTDPGPSADPGATGSTGSCAAATAPMPAALALCFLALLALSIPRRRSRHPA